VPLAGARGRDRRGCAGVTKKTRMLAGGVSPVQPAGTAARMPQARAIVRAYVRWIGNQSSSLSQGPVNKRARKVKCRIVLWFNQEGLALKAGF
ncbi:MAG: hypothetical protein ABFC78_03645, partial [Methanoregula sp.]